MCCRRRLRTKCAVDDALSTHETRDACTTPRSTECWQGRFFATTFLKGAYGLPTNGPGQSGGPNGFRFFELQARPCSSFKPRPIYA